MKTDEQKAHEREAERERAARRKKANARLAALPQSSRDAVRRKAAELEAAHTGRKPSAVVFLEQALDAFGADTAARHMRSAIAARRAEHDQPAPKRPKGPREKSTPKEAGRPKPETKDPKNGAIDRRQGTPSADIDQLAANAKRTRGGKAAIKATVEVTAPAGELTAYCPSCDQTKPEAEFWPAKVTEKSKRRKVCRPCFNEAWRQWDAQRRAKTTTT